MNCRCLKLGFEISVNADEFQQKLTAVVNGTSFQLFPKLPIVPAEMSVARRTSWYFVSSISGAAVGMLTLPLYTTRLGPDEYGAFALGASLATVVSATAGSASTVSLPVNLNLYEGEELRRYVGAVLLLSSVIAILTCIAIFTTYSGAAAIFDLEVLAPLSITLAIAGSLLNSVWAICVEIMTIEGRAKHYAVTTILQVLCSVIAVCAAIFMFDEIANALFWGFTCAGAVGTISAIILLRGRLSFCEIYHWVPIAARGGLAAVTASLAENGKTAIERSYVGLMVGAYQLGLLAHGQLYKNSSMVIINAVSRGLVPTSLREAEAQKVSFRVTLQLWAPVQAMVVGITLCFALIGPEIINLLTHDKFSQAAPYTVAIMLTLLLQTSAKPHSALLLARGHGHVYANLNSLAVVLALIWLFVTVPFIGIWGAITSFVIQTLVHRVTVYLAANRICRVEFTDRWVIGGFIFTGLCLYLDYGIGLDFAARITLLFVFILFILWMIKAQLLQVWVFLNNR